MSIRLAALTAALLMSVATTSSAQPVPTWRLVEELRFDGEDAPGGISEIHSVAATRGGAMFVLDTKARSLLLFDARGRFVRRVARDGSGPGELQEANGMATRPDGSVWVNDPGNGRLSLYSADGAFIRQVSIQFAGQGTYWSGFVHRSGRIADFPVRVAIGGVDPRTKYPITEDRLRLIADDGRADTVKVSSCGKSPGAFVFRMRSGNATSLLPSFAAIPQQAISPGSTVWCTPSSEYSLLAGPLGGALKEVARRAHKGAAVSSAERRNALEMVESFKRKQGPLIFGDESLIPHTKPVIEQLLADDAERVWVRRGDGTNRFDVFDAGGRQLAEVTGANRINTWKYFFSGDKVYTVTTTEDDIPIIVRYRIDKPR